MQCPIFVGFIVLCFCGIILGQQIGPYYSRSENSMHDSDAEEIISNPKLQDVDLNFLSNWPFLKDLLPNENENYQRKSEILREIKNEIINPDEDIPEPLPTPAEYKARSTRRGRNQKKDYYMSICHFKICNMGRKRNTRYFQLYDIMNNLKNREAM